MWCGEFEYVIRSMDDPLLTGKAVGCVDNTASTVYRAILDSNSDRLAAPALLAGGECISYAELFGMTDKVADILATAGLKEGDMIIAQIHGTLESVALLLAASKIGVTVMMLNEQTKEETLAALVEHLDIRFIFIMEKFYLTIADYSFLDDDRQVIVLPRQSERTGSAPRASGVFSNIMKWRTFMNYPAGIRAKEVLHGHDPLNICSTSGSAGYPKGIIQTNQSCVELMRLFGPDVSGWSSEDAYACLFPFFLTSGQSFNLFLPLAAGMCVLIDPDVSLEAFYGDLLKNRPNIVLLVKYNWLRLIRMAEECGEKPDLSRLRKAYSVGAELTEAEREMIDAFLSGCGSSCRVFNLFGLSETNSILAFEKEGPSGRYFMPLEGVDVMCRSITGGEPLGAGLRGQMFFRTPCMMQGYLMEPRKTEKALVRDSEGKLWFDTEDVGYRTEDGGFVIEGRAKDLFRSGGKSVYVFEVKKLLEQCDGVRACEVYYSRNMDELLAYVVPEDESLLSCGDGGRRRMEQEETARTLEGSLVSSGKLELFPSKYFFLKAIPLARSGKPDIKAMLDLEDPIIPGNVKGA